MEYTLDLPDTLITKFHTLGYADPLEGLQDAAKLLLGLGPEAWGTITAESAAKEITPAKYILQRLNEQPTAGATTTARKPLRPNNAERDAQIWEMARTGSTHAKIAAQYDLSVIRVSQIVALQRAKSMPEKA
jgi:hypothetical protein